MPSNEAVVSSSPSTSAASDAPPRPRRNALFAVAGLAVGIGGFFVYRELQSYEDTDDAQVDGDISSISPRVSGILHAVHVVDNQIVKAGDLLAELDPNDFAVSVVQAKASVAQAEAELQAEDPNVSITETSNAAAISTTGSNVATAEAELSAAERELQQGVAQLAQAEANNRIAQIERDRSAKLVQTGAVSQADFDQRSAAADAQLANVNAVKQSVEAAKKKIDEQRSKVTASQSRFNETRLNAPRQLETRRATMGMRRANVEAAKAVLAQAELNLQYTHILAPVAGIVGRKSVNVGDHVQPGQQILAITQIDHMWITANFRETQLERMHPGQSAKIHVDALGRNYVGSVESMPGATGSRYSLLPPENATGNYVKVVQRLPVRIRLEPNQPDAERLRPGMSAEPKVSLR